MENETTKLLELRKKEPNFAPFSESFAKIDSILESSKEPVNREKWILAEVDSAIKDLLNSSDAQSPLLRRVKEAFEKKKGTYNRIIKLIENQNDCFSQILGELKTTSLPKGTRLFRMRKSTQDRNGTLDDLFPYSKKHKADDGHINRFEARGFYGFYFSLIGFDCYLEGKECLEKHEINTFGVFETKRKANAYLFLRPSTFLATIKTSRAKDIADRIADYLVRLPITALALCPGYHQFSARLSEEICKPNRRHLIIYSGAKTENVSKEFEAALQEGEKPEAQYWLNVIYLRRINSKKDKITFFERTFSTIKIGTFSEYNDDFENELIALGSPAQIWC